MTEDPAPYFANYAQMLQYLRKDKKMTIVELSQKMGVSQSYIVKMETGEIIPTKEQQETIRAFIDGRL
ncbi:MAG: helix-turn-helix transcriptional regulator [Desulfobacterales bacterium]|nr:helix-turn-helix transcriptional regulator [Desulfobacterales bacterium]